MPTGPEPSDAPSGDPVADERVRIGEELHGGVLSELNAALLWFRSGADGSIDRGLAVLETAALNLGDLSSTLRDPATAPPR